MEMTTVWWITCGVLVAAELATGTFYLLMLAAGAAGGAIAGWLGLGSSVQMIIAALIGGGAVLAWHRLRGSRNLRAPAAANPDVNIDIGQAVQVEAWSADGTASVRYRGAAWRARYAGAGAPDAGTYVIRAIDGSCLILDR
ncbi:NfeD family protein [Pelomonas sp. KK5]|uniref:NfeD family protein n=1 Tax=Pelomonas sp. KK5 TaxID=1855730 RepID=UPI00097BB124|nr:NfeD family protein [Pelomonas sp. KK5]